MSVPDYYNRVNRDLLRLIPPDAGAVLEVGCGAGALAREYRRINPVVLYLGVEMVPEAATAAASIGRVDRVFTGDAATVEPSDLGLSAFDPGVDCLVFGDVLEHMVDPWAALARLAQWVREGGQVLACIPNIQHYSVLVNLLRGQWQYRDEGLLDRTHLRFFTLQGVKDLFAGAGLRIFDIQPRSWPSADFDKFQQVMAPVLSALAIEPATFAAQTQAVQYIVRAVRAQAPPRRMAIWSLLGSVIGSEPRVDQPMRFLATIPGVRTLSGTGLRIEDLGRTWPGEERVFVQQRIVVPLADHLRLQRALLAERYLIVAEFDDDPQHFADLVHTDYFALRSCHCVQTTTEVMALTLRSHNPHIAVFPNQVATLADVHFGAGDDHSQHVATIFFGALNREADWAPLMPELNRVLEALRGQVRVQVVYDRAFFDALSTSHKVFEPLCSYDRYLELLQAADIGLLPLEPTRFNQHKSDLKFIECAANGVAALASSTVYGRTIAHDETGLVYQSPVEFGLMLERLIRDRPLRRRLGRNAFQHVAQNRMLARHYQMRYQWYRQMLERRDALEAELRARAPELAAP
jgi:SAM-dependent methyltransferase